MNQYDHIMSLESVWPFVVGYSVYGVMAVTQLVLGSILVISGLLGLFTHLRLPVVLNYVGVMIAQHLEARTAFGAVIFLSGLLLLMPLFGQFLFNVGLFGFLCVLTFTLCFCSFPELGKTKKGLVSRCLILVFALFGVVITIVDKQTPLLSMAQILDDIQTYRPLEQRWQYKYDEHAPKVGDRAPDFQLRSASSDELIRFSTFVGDKATVLFLGANTCPVFSAGIKDINQLHQRFGDQVNFVGVYVSEPHAIDEWPLTRTNGLQWWKKWVVHPVATDLPQALSFDERYKAASRMQRELVNPEITFLVDGMDNQVNNTWVGRPARIYLISKDGHVVYNPGIGPYSFNPRYLETLLKEF